MAGKRKLRKAYRNLDIQKLDDIAPIPGILGFLINGVATVRVANRPGYVYVRFRDNLSEVCQAYNDTVSLVYNLPVLVIRDKTDRSRYRIQGRDLGRYENWATSTAYLPMHGSQHSFNPPDEGGDVVWVYPQQIVPLMGYPSGTTGGANLFIKPYTYYSDGIWKHLGNTGSPSFLSYKPTSSNSKLALLFINEDGNPQITATGAEFPSTGTAISAIFPYLPALPNSRSLPIAAAKLSSGTSVIDWNNLYDLRQFITIDPVLNPPRVRLWRSTNQSISSGTTFQAIEFDTEVFDTDNMWSSVTGSAIFINTTGWYSMIGNLKFTASAVGERGIAFRSSSGTVLGYNTASPANVSTTGMELTAVVYLVAGSIIEFSARQTGGTLNVLTGVEHSPIFTCFKLPW